MCCAELTVPITHLTSKKKSAWRTFHSPQLTELVHMQLEHQVLIELAIPGGLIGMAPPQGMVLRCTSCRRTRNTHTQPVKLAARNLAQRVPHTCVVLCSVLSGCVCRQRGLAMHTASRGIWGMASHIAADQRFELVFFPICAINEVPRSLIPIV